MCERQNPEQHVIDYNTYRASENPNVMVVEVTGRLDVGSSEYLMKCIQEELDAGAQNIVLDFGSLEYISSMGLGTIVRASLRVKKQEGTIVLANVTGMVAEVMNIAGLGKLFHIYPDLSAAVESLADNDETAAE